MAHALGSPDKTQIIDLLFYRGSSKNNEIKDFWFFGIGSVQWAAGTRLWAFGIWNTGRREYESTGIRGSEIVMLIYFQHYRTMI